MIRELNKNITKPWKGNSTGSLVILIPKIIAEKNCLSTSSYVTVESCDGNSITIKKLDF